MHAILAGESKHDLVGIYSAFSSSRLDINPSITEASFVQSTMMQWLDNNHLNPVMLVFIG